MEWKDAAPWVIALIAVASVIAQAAVTQWRVGALDRWREDVEKRFRSIDEERGTDHAEHNEIFRRIERLEKSDDRA